MLMRKCKQITSAETRLFTAGANRDVMQTMEVTRFVQKIKNKKSSAPKIVNDGVSKTFVRALPYGTVWVDKAGRPFVVSGVANCHYSYLNS